MKDASEERWREKLTPEEFAVLRRGGTEPPFSGVYHDQKDLGMYKCRACGEPLFSSDAKYDSRTGWPSFFAPHDVDSVREEKDISHGMIRTEVVCRNCGSHLGHVFPDGPEKLPDGREGTGMRYCINSLSLDFKPKKEE